MMFGLQNTLKLFPYIRKPIFALWHLRWHWFNPACHWCYIYTKVVLDTNDVPVMSSLKDLFQTKLSHWNCVMFNPRLMYEMSLFKYRKQF